MVIYTQQKTLKNIKCDTTDVILSLNDLVTVYLLRVSRPAHRIDISETGMHIYVCKSVGER